MREIDIATARERVKYDPTSGRFVWLVSNRGHRRAGDEAGCSGRRGYRFVKIGQVKYAAARLAWALSYDKQPDGEVDHINGDPTDNRLVNLRLATRVQNCQNRKFEGVRYEEDRKKWLARIAVNGKTTNLGRYETKAEALAARKAATILHFGEFARV